ncbi:MAG TPA: hypothetical protein VGE65_03900 [Sphingobium sp.]
MSYNKDGLRHPSNFLDAAAWGYSIRVDCGRCSHMAIFDAPKLWWHFQRKGWEDTRWAAGVHFFCTKCAAKLRGRVRPGKISYVKLTPTVEYGVAPPQLEQKRALNRFKT